MGRIEKCQRIILFVRIRMHDKCIDFFYFFILTLFLYPEKSTSLTKKWDLLNIYKRTKYKLSSTLTAMMDSQFPTADASK
jgi:hypothetical protein